MTTEGSFWSVVVLAGVGTLLLRAAPMLAHGRVRTPALVVRLLRYVPTASLAALAVPGAVLVAQNGSYGVEAERIVAITVALFVALKWRNVALTLAVGMIALWVMQAIL